MRPGLLARLGGRLNASAARKTLQLINQIDYWRRHDAAALRQAATNDARAAAYAHLWGERQRPPLMPMPSDGAASAR